VLIERSAAVRDRSRHADLGSDIGVRAVADQRAHHCVTAACHGSWERPDNGFADMVLGQLPKATHPISKCQPGQETTPAKSALQASRNTTPATAPFPTPDDDERACQSPLFPVMAKPPTVCRASVPQAIGLPLANRKTMLKRSLRLTAEQSNRVRGSLCAAAHRHDPPPLVAIHWFASRIEGPRADSYASPGGARLLTPMIT
jgi:hypothetical protein